MYSRSFLCVLTVLLDIFSVVKAGVSTSTNYNVCISGSSPECTCSTENNKLVVKCSGNGRTNVPPDLPNNAYKIELKNYRLKIIVAEDFNGISALEELNLSNNQISDIASGALNFLPNLRNLTLKSNVLTRIDKYTFLNLISLTELDLSLNRIRSIVGDSMYPLHNLNILNLSGNPLHCDCEMGIFKSWTELRKSKVTVLDAECANFRNMSLFDVSSFGNCPRKTLFYRHNCLQCNTRSHIDCKTLNMHCPASEACYSIVTFQSGQLTVEKGCKTDIGCQIENSFNKQSCYNGSSDYRKCYYCCLDGMCNDEHLGGRTKEVEFYFKVQLNVRNFVYNSVDFNNTRKSVLQVLQERLNTVGETRCSFNVYEESIGPPGVIFHMNSICTTLTETQESQIFKALQSYLQTISRLVGSEVQQTQLLLNEDHCFSEYEFGVTWPTTPFGQTAQVYCLDGSTGERRCLSNGWESLSIGCDGVKSSTTLSSTTLSTTTTPYVTTSSTSTVTIPTTRKSTTAPVTTTQCQLICDSHNITEGNADMITDMLYNITYQASEFSDDEISMAVSILESVENLDTTFLNPEREQKIVGIMSNILNAPENTFAQSEKEFNSATRLLNTINTLTTKTNLDKGDFKQVRPNLGLAAVKTSTSTFSGMVLATNAHPSDDLHNKNLILSKDGTIPADSSSWIHLPKEMFKELKANSKRVTLAAFKTDKLFKIIKSGSNQNPKGTNIVLGRQSNSVVLAAQITNVTVDDLQNPVEIRFKQDKQNAENATCGYFIESGLNAGHWSSEGCRVLNHVPGDYTDCRCDHLTNFALLMDIYGVGGDIDEGNRKALTYLSYLGCGISLVGLVLTLITYFMFRKLRTNNPAKILINLCISIAATDLIFLAGQQEYALDSEIGCKIVAASLHLFLLSSMCWMLVEAYYMYIALVRIFNTHISKFMLKTITLGWGFPLVVVGVTLGVNSTDNYGKQAGGICWLDPIPFYAAFLAPVGIIIIINFIVFAMVLRQLLGSSKNLNKTDTTTTSTRLKGAITLVVMLGLTWVFAILAIDGGAPVFQYLFVVFNSLQGLFIFLFHCFMKPDARKAWKRTCCKTDKEKESQSSKDFNKIIKDSTGSSGIPKGYSSNDNDISKSTVSINDIKTDVNYKDKKTANGISKNGRSKAYPSYSGSSI